MRKVLASVLSLGLLLQGCSVHNKIKDAEVAKQNYFSSYAGRPIEFFADVKGTYNNLPFSSKLITKKEFSQMDPIRVFPKNYPDKILMVTIDYDPKDTLYTHPADGSDSLAYHARAFIDNTFHYLGYVFDYGSQSGFHMNGWGIEPKAISVDSDLVKILHTIDSTQLSHAGRYVPPHI
jgi:hypothetical protein